MLSHLGELKAHPTNLLASTRTPQSYFQNVPHSYSAC